MATSSGTTSAKPVASCTSSTVTPGCSERTRMRWSSVSKSNTPRSDTTRRTSKKRAGLGPQGGGPVPPDAADHVDRLDEHLGAVAGHPVARGVVDGVARGAADAEQLHLGPVRVRARGRRCSGCRTGRPGWRPSSRGAGRSRPRRTCGGRGSRSRPPAPSAATDAASLAMRVGLAVGHHQVGLVRRPGPGGPRSWGSPRWGWPGSRRRREAVGHRGHAHVGPTHVGVSHGPLLQQGVAGSGVLGGGEPPGLPLLVAVVVGVAGRSAGPRRGPRPRR